jgi:hypothetical protein
MTARQFSVRPPARLVVVRIAIPLPDVSTVRFARSNHVIGWPMPRRLHSLSRNQAARSPVAAVLGSWPSMVAIASVVCRPGRWYPSKLTPRRREPGFFLKQVHYQRNMQAMQPPLQAIKEKYKNDRQAQQREMMRLQQEGFNPLTGCLPMLLQIPIFIALFHVLRHVSNSASLCHPIQVQNAKLSLYGFTATQTCMRRGRRCSAPARRTPRPGQRPARPPRKRAPAQRKAKDKRVRQTRSSMTGTILNCRWERVRGVPTCAQRTHSLINCASV